MKKGETDGRGVRKKGNNIITVVSNNYHYNKTIIYDYVFSQRVFIFSKFVKIDQKDGREIVTL